MKLQDIFNPEGVWGTIVSSILASIPKIVSYIGTRKQWKITKEKSSRDQFTSLFFRGLLFYIVYVILSLFAIVLLTKIGYKEMTQRMISITLGIVIGAIFCIYEYKEKKVFVKECFTGRLKIILEFMAILVPVFISVMLSILYIANPGSWIFIASKICSWVLLAAFLIFGICIIDAKKEFRYKRAKVYLKNKEKVKNIDVTTIYFKGGWVIVKKINEQSEVRFKNKDIERVEYTEN